MTDYREIHLPNGNVLVIKFEKDGIVYDLWNSDQTELIQEFGYDLYYEDIPVTRV